MPIELRLAITTLLRCKMGDVIATFAVCCSSWILTSRGSSWRSVLCPLGNTGFAKVRDANLIASRLQGLFAKLASFKTR